MKKSLIRLCRLRSVLLIAACFGGLFDVGAGSPPTITGVTASQRAGTKLVDISYNISDPDSSTVSVYILVSQDSGATWTVPAFAVTGDYGPSVAVTPTPSAKSIVWNAGADWNGQFTDKCRVRVVVSDANVALIPAGSFQRGSYVASQGGPDPGDADAPVFSVSVSGFLMGRTPVTVGGWDTVQGYAQAHGYDLPTAAQLTQNSGVPLKGPNFPVLYPNWYQAVKWCNARSEMEGATPVYYTDAAKTVVYRSGQVTPYVKAGDGYRLPTEAEWEKAARGGVSGRRFPWGDTIDWTRGNYIAGGYYHGTAPDCYYGDAYLWDTQHVGPGPICDCSTTDADHDPFCTSPNPAFLPDSAGLNVSSPVGYFPPNGYNLYDMGGNVWEWCWDWYSSSYYTAGQSDPQGPASGTERVFRNGSFAQTAGSQSCAGRSYGTPDALYFTFGFRCAKSLTPGLPTGSTSIVYGDSGDFTLNTYNLFVATSGPGSVVKYPDQSDYSSGSVVTLTAIPNCGAAFSGWSGAASGTQNPLTVVAAPGMLVKANFTALSCACPPSGLVSWWKAELDANDNYMNNPGTLVGDATFDVGKVGAAFFFDGAAGVVVPNGPTVNFGAGDSFTFEMWIRVDGISAAGRDAVLHKIVPGVGGYTIELVRDEDQSIFEIDVIGPVVGVTTFAYASNDGNFHHLAVSLNRGSGTLSTYMDGVPQSSTSVSGFSLVNSSRLWIGHQTMDASTSAQPFLGAIDELSLYNRGLTAGEIQALYSVGSAGKCQPTCMATPPGLVGWWPAAGNANDVIGNNNGTLPATGVTLVPGKSGTAFSFDGVNGGLNIPGFGSVLPTSEITIEFWQKVNALRNQFTFTTNPQNSSDICDVSAPYGDGKVYFEFGNNSPSGGQLSYTPPNSLVGSWQHFACVASQSGSFMRIYRNGVKEAEKSTMVPFVNGTYDLVLGGISGGLIDGMIDEFSVYNRALSEAEILGIYNAGSAGKCLSQLYITSATRSENKMKLTWLSQKGMRYHVQYTTDLRSGVWSDTDVPGELTAAGTTTSASVPDTATQRFYRVVMFR